MSASDTQIMTLTYCYWNPASTLFLSGPCPELGDVVITRRINDPQSTASVAAMLNSDRHLARLLLRECRFTVVDGRATLAR